MIDLKERSWFTKYQPKQISDLIFDSDEFKNMVTNWINNDEIDGNVLLFGPPGLGKTATSELLVTSLIKHRDDLLYTKKTGVDYIDDVVKPFVSTRPKKSKKKIVYMEEFDRLKSEAQNALKKDTLEKYQHQVSFICCTNHIRKIESALLTRFNYKISFSGTNIQGMIMRLEFILKSENAEYDEKELESFVNSNYKAGMREMINQLENSFKANNKKIIFKNISDCSSVEEHIVGLITKMINQLSSLDIKSKRVCIELPDQSQIKEDYKKFTTILHNNFDINYSIIYDRLMEVCKYVPIRLICGKYADNSEFKRYPHLNLIGCVYEMFKCISEIMR